MSQLWCFVPTVNRRSVQVLPEVCELRREPPYSKQRCPRFKLNVEINKAMALDNISYMEARRAILKLQHKNTRTGSLQKDQRNFPFINQNLREKSTKFSGFSGIHNEKNVASYAGMINCGTTTSSSTSSTRMESLDDLIKKISFAPDQNLIIQRLLKTINLHITNANKELSLPGNNIANNDSRY